MKACVHRHLLFLVAFVLSMALFTTGCFDSTSQLVQKIEFSVSPNLETVTLTLSIDPALKANINGDFPIKQYGNLFLNPSTVSSPLQLGFRLNTNIFDDQDYGRITPTTVLPNGMGFPFSTNWALVQLAMPQPLNPAYDIFAYIDVYKAQWLGSAAIITATSTLLPPGLVLSQTFFRDEQGHPGAIAMVFGPKVENGTVKVAGGIALFGNVQRLIHIHQQYQARMYRSYTKTAEQTPGPEYQKIY